MGHFFNPLKFERNISAHDGGGIGINDGDFFRFDFLGTFDNLQNSFNYHRSGGARGINFVPDDVNLENQVFAFNVFFPIRQLHGFTDGAENSVWVSGNMVDFDAGNNAHTVNE